MGKKVICYVDGFNLYHAIDDLNKPHLKWLNLWSLAESYCRPGEDLVRTSYFSAYATWLPAQYARHREYVRALEAAGVSCHMARFNTRLVTCHGCSRTWRSREEKETDVHFALSFLEDALDGKFNRAIIISADSDYLPAIRKVRARLPAIEVFVAPPPGRFPAARGLISVANSYSAITAGRVAKCLFPEHVKDKTGSVVATRPPSYAPPT